MNPRKQCLTLSVILFLVTVVSCWAQTENFVVQLEQERATADDERKAEIFHTLITYYGGHDVKKARSLSEELIQWSKRSNNPAVVAWGLSEEANVLRRAGKQDSALLFFHRAFYLAKETPNETVKGKISYRLGQFYDGTDADSAEYYFRVAARHFEIANEEHLAALALVNESAVFRKRGQLDTAKFLLDEATAKVDQVLLSDSSYWPARAAATVASFHGVYNNLIGRYEESLRWNLRSVRFFENVDDRRSQGAVLHTMGTTYRKLLKYERSIDAFRRALEKFRAVNDLSGVEAAFESTALVYDDMVVADSAEHYFNKALQVAVELKNTAMQGNIYNNLGAFYLTTKKNYAQAAIFFEKAFEVRGGESGANLWNRATAMINLGQVSVKLGNLDKASAYLKKGLALAEELHSPDYKKSALEGMIMCLQAKQDFRLASMYQDSLLTLKDSIYNSDSKSKVAEMEVRYDTERKEQEILLLKVEAGLANFKQYAWMAAFGAAIVVVLLMAFTFYNRRARISAELALAQKEKEVIQSEIAYKDRELVNLATYITEKNNFLESVLETISAIDLKNEGAQRQLEKLTPLIRENINLSGSRDEFNAFMTSVYGGFIKKLEERYPDLTDYEKRLATLLRVNLTSKQIASVLNISPKSVDMSRYRLRKKMQLSVDQEIPEALTTL
jgi:tetratricopeptide (TPR) repeat protein